MPRRIPDLSEHDVVELQERLSRLRKTPSSGRVRADYTLRLVTPMYGGGAIAGVPDEQMPIRASSIRGQLRFWWRVTRGAACQSVAELRQREAQIWGSTEDPSPVDAQVELITPGGPQQALPKRLRPDFGFPATSPLRYALFAAYQNENVPSLIREGLQFRLRLEFPADVAADVQGAVWAWTNFGGLGSRTRRGCGSLYCAETAPRGVSDLGRWWKEASSTWGWTLRERPQRWPAFCWRGPVYDPSEREPIEAWTRVMALYRRFRQGEEFGRSRGQGPRPGRSRYPEPEAIRKCFGMRAGRHERLENIPDTLMPRATLGLPIVFHFQSAGSGGRGDREPPHSMLVPLVEDPQTQKVVAANRLASCLIMKPLAVSATRAVACVLPLLSSGNLKGVELQPINREDRRSWRFCNGQPSQGSELEYQGLVTSPAAATYPKSPLAASPSGLAFDAFLQLLKGDRAHWGNPQQLRRENLADLQSWRSL